VGARLSADSVHGIQDIASSGADFDEGAVDPESVLEGEQNLLSFFRGKAISTPR